MNSRRRNHNTAYYSRILRELSKDARVLDVGCGDGYLVSLMAKNADLQ